MSKDVNFEKIDYGCDLRKDVNFEIVEEDMIRNKYNRMYKKLSDDYLETKMKLIESHTNELKILREKYKAQIIF